jgi:hypothetical protein
VSCECCQAKLNWQVFGLADWYKVSPKIANRLTESCKKQKGAFIDDNNPAKERFLAGGKYTAEMGIQDFYLSLQ